MISGLGRSPGEGNDYPLQYSCLENPKDRGAWRATVHGVAELDTIGQITLPSNMNGILKVKKKEREREKEDVDTESDRNRGKGM